MSRYPEVSKNVFTFGQTLVDVDAGTINVAGVTFNLSTLEVDTDTDYNGEYLLYGEVHNSSPTAA